MTSDKIAFLNILKDYLNRTKSEVSDDIDLLLLYEYAKKHNLTGVLYYQTKDNRFRIEYTKTIYQYHNRKKALEEIESELNKAGIQYFLVKGMVISQFYQKPELRTMGDCDIVVHDKKTAAKVLQSAGVEVKDDEVKEFYFSKQGVEFELHDHLLYMESFNEEHLQKFFNDCWPYVKDNKLDGNFHFLFAIAHLRKHFLFEGVGFRLFMDIAVFSQQNLDWEWIKEKLDELKLMDFARICFTMIERWFGIVCPIEAVDISDEFYENATDTIFKNGVYGGTVGARIARVASERKQGNKAVIFIRRVFPSYQKLRYERICNKFLDGRPWLLPFAWVYHLCVAWKRRNKLFEELFQFDEAVIDKQKQLEDWKIQE